MSKNDSFHVSQLCQAIDTQSLEIAGRNFWATVIPVGQDISMGRGRGASNYLSLHPFCRNKRS